MQNKKDICVEIANLAERYLDLEKWKFRESIRLQEYGDSKVPCVIYNSQLCRVTISFNEWHPPHQSKDYTVDVHYGRLIASNYKDVIINNGEECHCWHGITKALHFLDNCTPEYAAKNLLSHDLIKKYVRQVSSESFNHNLPEWEIRKHAYIWEEYAPRLFELFDVRRPDLWAGYRKFLKELYDIKGRSPNIKPSLDQVC